MKSLPILSIALFSALTIIAFTMNSCGDDEPAKVDPDAMPRPDAQIDGDSGVALHCVPLTGTNYAMEEVARNLENPLFVDAPKGDERLFIVEQTGKILLYKEGALLPTPFLDLAAIITDNGDEQGLLGLAFHPEYTTNGRFFVYYTASSPNGDTVVAEYTVSGDADVANTTGKVLLTIDQPQGNHNGGMIEFGPDGTLFIGSGDGGGGGDDDGGHTPGLGNGQDITKNLGKILRIDVDNGDPYSIPATNPYAGGGGSPEIWAYGIRNPWRFSFDSMTGELYTADVGQGDWEEVNVVSGTEAGINYGWRQVEGDHCFNPSSGCDRANKTDPVHEYPHTQGRRSITGGYVYRGDCLPDVVGRYFFADYVSGQIYSFVHQTGTATDLQEHTDLLDPNSDIVGLTSFGTDGYGEMYLTSRGSQQGAPQGKVYRIVVRP